MRPTLRRAPARLRRIAVRALAQDGDTLIEVVVAAFLGAIVISALALAFVKGNDASLGAQRETALIEAANQEMETISQDVKGNVDGFSGLAMAGAPPAASTASVAYDSATPLDPDSYVTSCSGTSAYEIESNYDDSPAPGTSADLVSSIPVEPPCATAGLEPLIVNATGGFVPAIGSTGSQQVTSGSMTIDLYDYVTATSVGCNASLGSGSCTDDARRVIVAAVDSQAASKCSSAVQSTNRCAIGADSPVYLTTIFTNPIPSNSPNSSIGITLGVQLG
jgi:hypothetical protein